MHVNKNFTPHFQVFDGEKSYNNKEKCCRYNPRQLSVKIYFL